MHLNMQAKVSLDELATHFTPTKVFWEKLRVFGLINRSLPPSPKKATSEKVLAHARQNVVSFRESMGISVCVFKVGVTANPAQRYISYLAKNFSAMWVVYSGDCVREAHMLEAALIQEFHSCTGRQNSPNSGGEGALNRQQAVGPFFAYVTGGRADQHKRVG